MLRAVTVAEDRQRIWDRIDAIQYIPEIAAEHAAAGIVISSEERLRSLKAQLRSIIFEGGAAASAVTQTFGRAGFRTVPRQS